MLLAIIVQQKEQIAINNLQKETNGITNYGIDWAPYNQAVAIKTKLDRAFILSLQIFLLVLKLD